MKKTAMFIRPWCAFLERRGRRPYRFVQTSSQFLSRRAEPPKIVSLAGAAADSLPRHSGSSLDEGQDIRNLHLPEVAAAPSNFVPDLPRNVECRSPRSETTKLSSFSLFYDGRSRMALTRYRNCFRDSRLCAACLTNPSISNKERLSP